MNCTRIWANCECGSYAHPHSFWLTDAKALLVTCICLHCEKQLNVIFPLADLFKACPPPTIDPEQLNDMVGEEITRITQGDSLTQEDKDFLHAFHIRDEEES